jgi:hypothetical protein
MNLSKPCPQFDDQSCQVSCQDPTQATQCVLLQTPLIDGSPCGKADMLILFHVSKHVIFFPLFSSTLRPWRHLFKRCLPTREFTLNGKSTDHPPRLTVPAR